jgi:hypothetical protein
MPRVSFPYEPASRRKHYQVGHRDLGSRHQVARRLVGRREGVFAELGQLPGARHGFPVDQVRQVHFRVTVLGGVHVEHELREGPVQARQRTAQYRESGPSQFGRRFRVQQSVQTAQLDMVAGREFELRLFAPPADFDVLALVTSFRNVRQREVRHIQ